MNNKRPLFLVTREMEWEYIQNLLVSVDNSNYDPDNTAVLMVSPDYSATVAMHLAHGWSKNGRSLDIIPIEVPYPDQTADQYITEFRTLIHTLQTYDHLVLVEVGIIRGGNWKWLLNELNNMGFQRKQLTLVAMCENINSVVKSDYVAKYYDDTKEDLTLYFERFNKHWPA